MLRRPFLKHPLRQSILSQPNRPTFRTCSIPLQTRFYAAHPQNKRDNPLWFVATSIISFAFFFYIVKKKRGLDPMNQNPTDDVRKEDQKNLPVLQTAVAQPIFSKEYVHVIFVLGGPGTGKGTQCQKLVKDWDFIHLSAGDLLRAEQARPESKYGALIRKFIQEGEIVPMEITVGLLRNAMQEYVRKDQRKFLIDGFPRKMDQALAFEANVCESKIVLYLEAPEDVMVKRLMGRGRSDDTEETIKKRLRVNQRDAEPVVAYFDRSKKLVRVNCNDSPEGVYSQILIKIQAIIEGWER